jgi:histidine ammonia-lyase
MIYEICPAQPLTIERLNQLRQSSHQLKLSDRAKESVAFGHQRLLEIIAVSDRPIYGVNTGFGDLKNTRVSDHELTQLQENLIMSHACGTGKPVPVEVVRLMMLLKLQGLVHGNSGVQLETVQLLVDLYNNRIFPVVYEQGSLGASGDLAPLAHLALPVIGKGEVNYYGSIRPAVEVMQECGLTPVKLKAKEGLAILNGTQFMSAWSVYCLIRAKQLTRTADGIAAMSLDAFDGLTEPYDPRLHDIRPHAGQIEVASNILGWLDGSAIAGKPANMKHDVQDPYSFRCIPQVHGATRDAIGYVERVVITEINSVTDNPTLFPHHGDILSGGNFHGQPLALVLDFLAIALSELANISERRTYLLISGKRNLPPMLVKQAGLNSGFMIPQYTAAAIVSQNKQLCTPASVDSIVSSNGQEDHVSMGANAATKCARVVDNVRQVLAIELLNAAQALDLRIEQEQLQSSERIMQVHRDFRSKVTFYEQDREMYPDLAAADNFLNEYNF